jgi:hypothetical protein
MRSSQRSEVRSAHSTEVRSPHSAEVTSADSTGGTSSAPARLGPGCYDASDEGPTEQNNHHSFQHRREPLFDGLFHQPQSWTETNIVYRLRGACRILLDLVYRCGDLPPFK